VLSRLFGRRRQNSLFESEALRKGVLVTSCKLRVRLEVFTLKNLLQIYTIRCREVTDKNVTLVEFSSDFSSDASLEYIKGVGEKQVSGTIVYAMADTPTLNKLCFPRRNFVWQRYDGALQNAPGIETTSNRWRGCGGVDPRGSV
jgi:hypothetical protein